MLDDIRAQITDSILGAVALLAIIQLVSLFVRDSAVSDPAHWLRVAIQITFICLFVLRARVPSKVKAWLLIFGGLAAGTTSVLSFGASAGGFLILFGVVVVTILMINIQIAVFVFLLALLPVIYNLYLVSNGLTPFSENAAVMNSSSVGWIFQLVIFVYMSVLVILTLNRFLHMLVESNEKLAESQQKLSEKAKQSDMLLRAAVDAVPYRIFWKDKDLKFLGANRRFLKDAKVESESELLGKSTEDLPWKHLADSYTLEDKKVIETKTSILYDEQKFHAADGNDYYILINRVPLKDQNNEVIGVLGCYDDITRQKRTEFELEHAIELANEANKAKSEFLANMSHELRTPLNGVYGLINMCLDTQLTQEQEEWLQKAKLSTDSLKSIINDILDISKIEANKLDIERIAFCPHDVVRRLHALLETLIVDKDLTLKIQNTIPEKLRLVGDPTRLLQILVNLGSNAVKFTKRGEIVISLKHEEGKLHYSVADQGAGIEAEKLSHLFQNFTQADSSITRKFGGTGLGLAICKRLTELMGGEIFVESTVNKGSHFYGYILADIAQEKLSSSQSERLDDHIKEKSVLLVEDNDINRLIAEKCLVSAGANVTTATDGAQAIDFVKSDEFDAIIMDIQMPVMDGIEAIKAIRALNIVTPVIALTANVLASEVQYYAEIGFNSHVAKPFDCAQLLSELNLVLIESEYDSSSD